MRGDQLLTEVHSWKFIVCGDEGTGKTFFAATVFKYLRDVLQLKPEEVSMKFLDLDGRLAQLIRQGVIPKEYLSRLDYRMCRDFEDVCQTTDRFIKELDEFVAMPGKDATKEEKEKAERRRTGSWFVVDNLHKAWKGAQSEHAQIIYGKSMSELMRDKRQEARRAGKATLPTFNRRFDYGVINPRHEEWITTIVYSGYNFIFCSPLKLEEIKNTEGAIVKVRNRVGQWENNFLVDYFLIKEVKDRKFSTIVHKAGQPFRITAGSFEEVVRAIQKYEKIERDKYGFKTTKELKKDKIKKDTDIEF